MRSPHGFSTVCPIAVIVRAQATNYHPTPATSICTDRAGLTRLKMDKHIVFLYMHNAGQNVLLEKVLF